MKTIAFLLLGFLLPATEAIGQTTHIIPDGSGGYIVDDPKKDSPTWVLPDGQGGYVIDDPEKDSPTWLFPDGHGGYVVDD